MGAVDSEIFEERKPCLAGLGPNGSGRLRIWRIDMTPSKYLQSEGQPWSVFS